MAKREGLSKKTRFEIFKRDGFTCQYCGRTSEESILEIDHIIPVSRGGTNDEMNLVTACFDCNRGKGNRELGNIIPRPDADMKYLETQQEIQELRRYKIAKDERDQLLFDISESLRETWASTFDTSYAPKNSEFIKLLNKLPPTKIEKAIYITADRDNLSHDFYERWKYMCGVAWNLLREEEE